MISRNRIIDDVIRDYYALSREPRDPVKSWAEIEAAVAARQVNKVFREALGDYYRKRYPHG